MTDLELMKSKRLPELIALGLLAAGLATIATAWGFQLVGGFIPCKLCLEQRIPYYAGLPVALVSLVLMRQGRTVPAGVALLTVAAIFAYGAGLGAYQAGAEWQFWDGPNDCGGGAVSPASAANMLQALQTSRIVSCTEASWRLFGLSFAGWNALAASGLAILAFVSAVLLNRGEKTGTIAS